jgi:hypothetical protein
VTGSSNGQITDASAPFGTATNGSSGAANAVQLSDGATGFSGSNNLNFQGGYLTINGNSGYGQLQWLNSPTSGGYAGAGISGTTNEIITGALAGDMTFWSSQAMNFSADTGNTNMLKINIDGTANVYGVFFPQQAPTLSAPTYAKGGMYFDTTLNKLRIGGATNWETITSV